MRRRYNVNILGVKTGDEVEPLLDPAYRFEKNSHLLIAGDKEAGLRLMGACLRTNRSRKRPAAGTSSRRRAPVSA